MKTMLTLLSLLASLTSFAEVIHKQTVSWVLQEVPGHKVTCKNIRQFGYYSGGRHIEIFNGTPRNIPTINLLSDQEFESCINFVRDEEWTLDGTYIVEVDDVCEVSGPYRRTLRELRAKVRENGMEFLGRSVVSKVLLPSTPTCRPIGENSF